MSEALALTMGEPAGIGGEIALRAWRERAASAVPPFFLIDDPDRIAALSARLGWDVPMAVAEPESAGRVFSGALPVVPLPLPHRVEPGRPDRANAPQVIESIACGVALVRQGRAAALVTNPIQKEVLYASGFPYPGHTEYLAALAGAQIAMLLACPELRVVPVTIHESLRRAIELLTSARIVATGRLVAAAMTRDFGISAPRLAIAGLNPHAGEGGAMGREEIDIIIPAIAELRRDGIDASGPWPPDTMFHAAARAKYDVALCMYHDQALIPLKTIDFSGGVNVTLGLPFIRTSPDHGTALDIAGTGTADPTSLVAALKLAANMAATRRQQGR
jgi:4-hydroxythreonine-4-phosphate dehydrogenase